MKSKTLICKISVGLIFSLCICVHAAPPKQVQMYIGELVFVGPNSPMQALANALKRDKKSQQFRVTWSDHTSMGGCKATVLYDRKTHTIKHYATSSHRISDQPEKWDDKQESYMYRSVNDGIIYRFAAKNRNTTQYTDTDAFFSELTLFGCKKRRLSYKVSYQTP